MAANVDAMLRAAIDAYRAGNKADARALLDKVLEVDEYNENAWMWMSASVETPEEQRTCLENVLVINPNNQNARKGLKSLGFDPDATTMVPPPAAAPAAFTDTSFADDLPAGGASVWDDDVPPTASSSASSTSFRGAKTSANDLDSWISGMGIGGAAPKPPGQPPASNPFSSSSFDEDEAETGFDDLDNRLNSIFDEDEFDQDEPPAPPAKPMAAAKASPPANRPASPAFTPPSVFDDDEDDDGEALFEDDDVNLNDSAFDEFMSAIEEEAPALPPVRRTGTARAVSRGSDYAIEEEQVDGPEDGPDPAKLFAQIPKDIKMADRLPGEDEESPRTLLIGVVALVVLNVLALAFVVFNAI